MCAAKRRIWVPEHQSRLNVQGGYNYYERPQADAATSTVGCRFPSFTDLEEAAALVAEDLEPHHAQGSRLPHSEWLLGPSWI